jgi:hypothetical protein
MACPIRQKEALTGSLVTKQTAAFRELKVKLEQVFRDPLEKKVLDYSDLSPG